VPTVVRKHTDPDCNVGLIGRGLLCKLRTQLTFDLDGMATLKLRGSEVRPSWSHKKRNDVSMPLRVSPKISELPLKIPDMQTEENPSGLTQNVSPVVVELKPGTTLTSQKQYFIPHEAQVGIQKHLDKLLKNGILQPCPSSWNTSLLPVQKPGTEDFRQVPPCSKFSNCYSAPCDPKSLYAFRLCPKLCRQSFLPA
jgi:hypothetical protein